MTEDVNSFEGLPAGQIDKRNAMMNRVKKQTDFEPMALRPKYRAEAPAWDAVELNERLAMNVREGFYDGTRVRVYQGIDGKLVKIRDTKVKPGGLHASEWIQARCGYSLRETSACKIPIDASFLPKYKGGEGTAKVTPQFKGQKPLTLNTKPSQTYELPRQK